MYDVLIIKGSTFLKYIIFSILKTLKFLVCIMS